MDTPELQRIRLDLATAAKNQSRVEKHTVPPLDLWEAVHRYETIRKRVERLGISHEDLKRIHEEAERRRPTPETLQLIRKQVDHRALVVRPRRFVLPSTKTITRAFIDLQKARARGVALVAKGIVRLQYGRHRRMAQALKASARRDLFFAKERRLAQIGQHFRPIFCVTRIVLRRETKRTEKAIARCVGLAASQEYYKDWRRKYVVLPREQLRAQAQRLERPAQAELRPQVAQARAAIPAQPPEPALRRFLAGLEVLRRHSPEECAPLEPWGARPAELVERVAATAKGQPAGVASDVYRAALRAGQIGVLLEREAESRPVPVPARLASRAEEIQRISRRFQAMGEGAFLNREMLLSLPPKRVDDLLDTVRKDGLADAGPAWTLRADAARELAKKLLPALKNEVERQRGLG